MDIAAHLANIARINLPLERSAQISHLQGVYCFWDRTDGRAAYVGKGTGKYGLRGRIARQHLNPNYLEPRESVWTSKDAGQIARQVQYNGKLVIEKSYFRKQLARRHDLVPGHPCLEYLNAHFQLSFLELPDMTRTEIKTAESSLIAAWDPVYNRRVL